VPAHVLRFEGIGTWPNTEVQSPFASVAGRDFATPIVIFIAHGRRREDGQGALGGLPIVIVSYAPCLDGQTSS